jgi:hypothetical protein
MRFLSLVRRQAILSDFDHPLQDMLPHGSALIWRSGVPGLHPEFLQSGHCGSDRINLYA